MPVPLLAEREKIERVREGPPALDHSRRDTHLEHENEQIAVGLRAPRRPPVDPDPSDFGDAEAAGVRPPALMEVTTPSGRVWYIANLN